MIASMTMGNMTVECFLSLLIAGHDSSLLPWLAHAGMLSKMSTGTQPCFSC